MRTVLYTRPAHTVLDLHKLEKERDAEEDAGRREEWKSLTCGVENLKKGRKEKKHNREVVGDRGKE